jgi:hypothetical protein
MAKTSFVAIAAIAAAFATTAQAGEAARLVNHSGKVLVGRAGKLAAAAPGALSAGDRIIVAQGAARITWADGCARTVEPNSMLTISAASPCAGAAGLVTAGAAVAQADQAQGPSALQWGAIGLSAAAIIAGIATAADDLALSN